MTTQRKQGNDKGEGFDGVIADITRPTSHMPTVEASLTLSPQSLVSKEAQIKLWGITTHIQAKGSMFP